MADFTQADDIKKHFTKPCRMKTTHKIALNAVDVEIIVPENKNKPFHIKRNNIWLLVRRTSQLFSI